MAKKGFSRDTIAIIALTIVFAAIYGFLLWLLFLQRGHLKDCESTQSSFCPTILCNGDASTNSAAAANPSTAKPSNMCFPYAFRLTTDDATNSPGETNYECNFPLTGLMYSPQN